MTKQEELLEVLLREKLISFNQLTEAKINAEKAKQDVEEYLEKQEIIDPESMARYKAEIYSLPYELITDKKMAEEVIELIPFEVADNYKIICYERSGDVIKVGMLDPGNFKAVEAADFLAKKENLKVQYFVISSLGYKHAVKNYKTLKKEVDIALEKKTKDELADEYESGGGMEFEEVIKSAPVAKIVSVIMRHAVEGRASDIHVEPLQKDTRVRYRIDGILNTSLVLPKNVHNSIVARIKVLANLKLDETRMPQDGRVREVVNDKEIDFRVSVIPLLYGEKVVMRILDVTKGAPTLEELGYIASGLKIIKENIKRTDGMFLVTGPTGSGKSTTIFSIMNMLNKEGVNIATLEDPVEYYVQGVNQAQIRPEVGFTFASGLRSILRQDPDIIMVGEIRDNETAELAVHSSLTGHFVLSTLHTNDALGAIPRLIDMKLEPFLLGSTLNTVIAQRLARRICEHCKKEQEFPPDIKNEVIRMLDNMPNDIIRQYLDDYDKNKIVYYKGEGCSKCGNTGYSGRVAVVEVLDINDRIKQIVINKNASLNMEEVRKSQKFVTIQEDGILKVLKGLTTYEEILRVTKD